MLKDYAAKAEEEVLEKIKHITAAIEACPASCQEHMKICKERMKTEAT